MDVYMGGVTGGNHINTVFTESACNTPDKENGALGHETQAADLSSFAEILIGINEITPKLHQNYTNLLDCVIGKCRKYKG